MYRVDFDVVLEIRFVDFSYFSDTRIILKNNVS